MECNSDYASPPLPDDIKDPGIRARLEKQFQATAQLHFHDLSPGAAALERQAYWTRDTEDALRRARRQQELAR